MCEILWVSWDLGGDSCIRGLLPNKNHELRITTIDDWWLRIYDWGFDEVSWHKDNRYRLSQAVEGVISAKFSSQL